MLTLKKPPRLRPGDTVAAVSLCWGAAGKPELRWRYDLGKRRLEERFGLHVVEMAHTLAPEDEVAAHPERRAADLMAAFSDPRVRAVFNVIGGSDSIRMLPYIDFAVLRAHPKIFCGYSDGTVTDFLCMKAGLASFYGAHILNDFGEPGRMAPYTEDLVRRLLFTAAPPGEIAASPVFSGHDTDWSRPGETRRWEPDCGYLPLQGGRARGPLLGGCFEVFDDLWNTPLFPPAEAFDGAILFYEVCGEPTEERYRARLRRFGEAGLLTRIAGLLMGKPLGGAAALTLYNRVTREVLAEYGRAGLPVLANASFGHNAPSGVIPMGALAEIDGARGTFAILEATVG